MLIYILLKIFFPDVLIVPGGSGARLAMEDPDVIQYLKETSSQSHSILSICTGMYLMQRALLRIT